MKNVIRFFFAFMVTVAGFSGSASAQVYGTYTPCNNGSYWASPGQGCNSQRVIYSGQNVGWSNQPRFQQTQVIAPALPQGCYTVKKTFWNRLKDGAGEAILTAIPAAFVGAAVDRDRDTGGRFTEVAASAGAGVGFMSTLSNDTTVVCQSQQSVQHEGHSSAERQASGGATCVFPQRDREGLTEEQCKRLGGEYILGAYSGQQQTTQQVIQHVSVQQAQTNETCTPPKNPAGTKQGILNLPGNPLHGQTVCAKPGDPNISKWL